MENERRDKILRLVEENLAKDGRVFRLVHESDEVADSPECDYATSIVAGTVRTVIEDAVRIK